jgi:GTP-binding protein
MRCRAALPDANVLAPDADRDEDESESGGGEPRPARPIRIAVVGRPNSGKSTLINRLLGEERLLTGPEAGITRDAIAVELTWHGQSFPRARYRRDAAPGRIEEKLESCPLPTRSMPFASPRWWSC